VIRVNLTKPQGRDEIVDDIEHDRTACFQAGLKEEDMLDTDALQAHLSGMNSYKYNRTVESWM